MEFAERPTPRARAAVAHARRSVFWLDREDRPDPLPPVDGDDATDLLVVGGGFTGLWTALLAKEQDPSRDVLLVEGGRIAEGATGRNGGFVAASLTHGFANGMERWPQEMPALLRLGRENLDAIERTVERHGIDCDFVRVGEIDVAVAPHQVPGLREFARAASDMGESVDFLDQQDVQARVGSPSYLAGAYDRDGVALVDPARLAWGLQRACRDLGVRISERTPVRHLDGAPDAVIARTDSGVIRASKVALGTNAYPPLLRRLSQYVVPVYDYVLVTEPLTDDQWSRIGWSGREGVSDSGNQFHYYRVTADGRILWGGYDAIYHSRRPFGREHENRQESYELLAEHFLQTFPQLQDIRFSHAWGGAIDTCSRFSAFWGTAYADRLAYVAGYTGLGVGASRFGAATMLDLLDGLSTERTRLSMVNSKPVPFPPEPLRGWGIRLTTASLRQADRNTGRRNLWLRTLDQLGLGFDS